MKLKRIVDGAMGNATREATLNEKMKFGRCTGHSIQGVCWICCKYLPRYISTIWCCVDCNTPLCRVDCTGPERTSLCVNEHLDSVDPRIKCVLGKKKGHFSSELKHK
jgi:hypothetical protein